MNCGVGEDSWESHGQQGDQRVHPKGNQSWIFIGRTVSEAPILWPPDAKSWLFRKDPDAGKDWGQEEKGTTEDEMVGWHYWHNGHEYEQALGDGEGQGSLVCCSPWGRKESDTTEPLNNSNNNISQILSRQYAIAIENFNEVFCLFFFWLGHSVCRILVLWPGRGWTCTSHSETAESLTTWLPGNSPQQLFNTNKGCKKGVFEDEFTRHRSLGNRTVQCEKIKSEMWVGSS